MNWITQNLWLIPALPLLAAGLSALLKQRQRGPAAALAIGSMGISFLLSLCAFAHTLGKLGDDARHIVNKDWLTFGNATLQLGWVLDPLTASMLVMVTFVGLLIFIFSVGYMAHDANFTRFFCFLALFAAAMLGLVISNSLLLLFMCWELVGLASYLLIGFWYHKPSAAAAAKKAFITTRIGDVFFFLGIVWLYAQTGTLLFYTNDGTGCLEKTALTQMVSATIGGGMLVSTAISLLIFCGAMGKSGQVPLHVWLPDAMEGPTPVSALIHAATMVAAGVFLVARVYPMMEATPARYPSTAIVAQAGATLTPALSLSERERENRVQRSGISNAETATLAAGNVLPLPGGEGRGEGERGSHTSRVSLSLQVVTWVGAITAVFAALIAVGQNDIKRILAYSTVSQLGYMMMGLGVGGVAVGMFHLLTHAFFKALLFLGSGSVIHGCHEEQDIRHMGGLKKFMPITFVTYAVGMVALAGVIPFAGFWSKDEILHAAHLWSPSHWPFYMGCFGALLTAFYMTRQMAYVFFGKYRGGHLERGGLSSLSYAADSSAAAARQVAPHQSADKSAHSKVPHESPAVMTIPLVILAVCAVLLGFFGTPAWPWLQTYLGAEHSTEGGSPVPLMILSTAIVAVGIGLGWWLYGRKPIVSAEAPDACEQIHPELFALLRDKFKVDELYEATVIAFNAWWARVCDLLDRWVWGGAVQIVSYGFLGIAWLSRLVDEYLVNLGFDRGCGGIRRGGDNLSRMQNGRAQQYLRSLAIAVAVLVLILTWGWRR